jgi:hypothetical protein
MKGSRLRHYLYPSLIFFALQSSHAQTGPAGVENSTTNVLWLKADAGTSTTVNGNPLSTWSDQSGNANHASQGTAANQPLYRTSVINSRPAIYFDNVGGTVIDELIVADNTSLDNTNGLTIFTISRPEYLDGAARAIISKRTATNLNESYMLFYYASNYFDVDVDGIGDRFPSATLFYSHTSYMIDMMYDGTQATASRSKLYVNGALNLTRPETSAAIPDYASNITIGSPNTGDGRPFGGFISEIIVYRKALNTAEKVIIDNYLAAKYNINMTANDHYVGDLSAFGDYEYEVAGVGTESGGSNLATATSVTGGLALTQVAGFEDGDYLIYGHDVGVNYNSSGDVGGMTGTLNSRWKRNWYIDVTNTGANEQVNLDFDMSDGGISVTPGAASNYVLLYRSGLSGTWTEWATASSVSGDVISFSGVTLTNDGYYTIGTHDNTNGSLPVELLYFHAQPVNDAVNVDWETASESGNDYFTVERSSDGFSFESLTQVGGSGTTHETQVYTFSDLQPLQGVSYYRLKQTDFDGEERYSATVPVEYKEESSALSLYPNPSRGDLLFVGFDAPDDAEVRLTLYDDKGGARYTTTFMGRGNVIYSIELAGNIEPGIYLVSVSARNRHAAQRLLIQR